jgi:hypothetical protein
MCNGYRRRTPRGVLLLLGLLVVSFAIGIPDAQHVANELLMQKRASTPTQDHEERSGSAVSEVMEQINRLRRVKGDERMTSRPSFHAIAASRLEMPLTGNRSEAHERSGRSGGTNHGC